MNKHYESNKYEVDIYKTRKNSNIRTNSIFTYIIDESNVNMQADIKCKSIQKCMRYIADEIAIDLSDCIESGNLYEFMHNVKKYAIIRCIQVSINSSDLIYVSDTGSSYFSERPIGFVYITFENIKNIYSNINHNYDDLIFKLEQDIDEEAYFIKYSVTDEKYDAIFTDKETGKKYVEGPFIGPTITVNNMYDVFNKYDTTLANYLEEDYIGSLF